MVKTATLALIISGLLNQTKAFTVGHLHHPKTSDVTTLHADIAVPDFSYTPNRFVQLNGTQGILQDHTVLRNSSAWRPTFGRGFFSITQNITLPKLKAFYNKTRGHISPFINTEGKLTATFEKSVFELTLNATAGSDCGLKISLNLLNLVLGLDTSKLGAMRALFILPQLQTGLKAAISTSLEHVLPDALAAFERQDFPNKLDLEMVCLELLGSDPTNYPEPLWPEV